MEYYKSRANVKHCEHGPATEPPENIILSKKTSFLSNASGVRQSECSVCGRNNNFKMDFIQPGSVYTHDKTVDLPVSNSKGRNYVSPRNMCKCRMRT